jgi:LacI family transcriptional regulator
MVKRVTSKDIAQLAGVSRTTVSFVLNNVDGVRIPPETRQRVADAAQQLGYYPDAAARSMASGRRRVLGFVVRQTPQQAYIDQFGPQVLRGLAEAASLQGYRTLFEPIPPDIHGDTYSRLLKERHADGIVLSGPRSDDADLQQLHTEGAPIVLMGQMTGSKIPFVDVDNQKAARMAVEHLIGLGHQRIAIITNALPNYTSSAERVAGYLTALEAHGIAPQPDLIRYGDMTPESGRAAMESILKLTPRPSAVFIASDTVALGALQAIWRCGLRIPQDMAVVGFDDIPITEFTTPPLTTVRLPAYDLGWLAANLLISLVKGHPPKTLGTLLETELIIRESCGA